MAIDSTDWLVVYLQLTFKGAAMERYANRGGDSGITGYEIAQGQITVQFQDGSQYLYNSQSPGAATVAEMQRLAVAGQGLNSYISRVVRKNFAQKLR